MTARTYAALALPWLAAAALPGCNGLDPVQLNDSADPGSTVPPARHERRVTEARQATELGSRTAAVTLGQPGDLSVPVTINFSASVLGQPLQCGTLYPGVGTGQSDAEVQDLRVYVHDVRLINDNNEEVSVELDERSPWQISELALLDFEDGTGFCAGDAGTNSFISGSVPAGEYVGVVFSVGVPFELNHIDPSDAPELLDSPLMLWAWESGYKHLRAEMVSSSSGAVSNLHLGTRGRGCLLDELLGEVNCPVDPPATNRPNRPEIRLTNFNVLTDAIDIDAGEIFKNVDLSQTQPCHANPAGQPACTPYYAAVGLDTADGTPLASQLAFGVVGPGTAVPLPPLMGLSLGALLGLVGLGSLHRRRG